MGGGCMGMGGGNKSAVTDGTAICSAHNRKRTIRNLADDGMGGFRCTPQNQCQGTGGGGMSAGGMSGGCMSAGQKFAAGDWNCPACGDHQFARNTNCRKCGADKPMDVGIAPY